MKYHQNISIDGVDQPAEYGNRKHSAFFNEGKWRNFIQPLLPPDPEDRVFVEIGCNVGLFLKLATEYGFGRVVGVEADPANCRMAERYRDANGMDYKILNRTAGQDFDWDELPVADVVLLSNVHYYIPMAQFMPLIDRMRFKTVTCLVVSRRIRQKKHGYPLPDIEPLRLMFRDWRLVRVLDTSSRMLEGDPHPRRVFSLLFQSQLERQPIGYHTQGGHDYPKVQELIDIVRSERDVRLEDTMNWSYWTKRKQEDKEDQPKARWSDDKIREHIQYRLDTCRDIVENGMKEPILVRPDRIGIDGGNRAAILKVLGHQSIIVRLI